MSVLAVFKKHLWCPKWINRSKCQRNLRKEWNSILIQDLSFLHQNSSEKVFSCFVHLHVGGGGCYHYIPLHHIYRLFLISSWNERVSVTLRNIHRVLDPKTSHPMCWAMSLALVISSLLVSLCNTLLHHPEDGEGPWTTGTKKKKKRIN